MHRRFQNNVNTNETASVKFIKKRSCSDSSEKENFQESST